MRKWRRCIGFMVVASFRATPLLASAVLVLTALSAIAVPLSTLGLVGLVNGAAQHNLHAAVESGLLTAGFAMFAFVVGTFALSTLRMTMEERTRLYLECRLLSLCMDIPGIAHLERGEVADNLELLRGGSSQLSQPAGPLVFLFSALVSLVTMLGLLGRLSGWLLFLPLFGLPSVVASGKAARLERAAMTEVTEPGRLATSLFRLLTEEPAAKEVRVFGTGSWLSVQEDHLEYSILQRLKRASVIGAAWNVTGSFLFTFGYIGSISLIVIQVAHHKATLGDLVLTIFLGAMVNGLVSQFASMTSWLVRTLDIVSRYLLIEDLAESEPSQPEGTEMNRRLNQGISFEHVDFVYPNTDSVVLSDVNLVLPAGSTVALVGDNGAGKSTLVKLLCRLYSPTRGRISADGMDISLFPASEWRGHLSAAFQDFLHLQFTARESIGVGDLEFMANDRAVRAAAHEANGQDLLDSLPLGLETQLGNHFDNGVEVSGGEWQKIALARALMRQAPFLLVLDEPTASLDAETEHSLFRRFAAARKRTGSTGGITLLVSHRFSTVRMADLIIVLEGGRVTEVGTHDDLLEQGGTYAELYRMQADSYS